VPNENPNHKQARKALMPSKQHKAVASRGRLVVASYSERTGVSLPHTKAVGEGWRVWAEGLANISAADYRALLMQARALGRGSIVTP
jgi:hypothetical protein